MYVTINRTDQGDSRRHEFRDGTTIANAIREVVREWAPSRWSYHWSSPSTGMGGVPTGSEILSDGDTLIVSPTQLKAQ